MWPSNMRKLCIPKNVVFLSYKEPMGMDICTGSVVGVCSSLLVLAMFYKYRTYNGKQHGTEHLPSAIQGHLFSHWAFVHRLEEWPKQYGESRTLAR